MVGNDFVKKITQILTDMIPDQQLDEAYWQTLFRSRAIGGINGRREKSGLGQALVVPGHFGHFFLVYREFCDTLGHQVFATRQDIWA